MKRLKTLLKAPLLSQSGYSHHSRQIFRALANDPAFDLSVEVVGWGTCSFVTEDTDEKRLIRKLFEKHLIEKQKGEDKYDLFLTITIPNEFEKKGQYNTAITAGIEVDRVTPEWLQKANEMDLLVVPSEHSKYVFERTTYDMQNKQTGEVRQLKLETPIVVCAEGVDTSVFKNFREGDAPQTYLDIYDKWDLDFEPEFNFLHIGQWGKGGFGEDRKNIANLVRYFIETFYERNDVGLVLKTNMSKNSTIDKETILNRLREIKSNFDADKVPPIYLVHGNMKDEELAALYNHPKIKSFISLTHGEGYGLPLLEAASCNLPVLATNWSGHLDFLSNKFSKIDYDMKEIPESAVWDGVMMKGSQWAEVKVDDVKRRMKKIVSSYYKPKEWAKELVPEIVSKYDIHHTNNFFLDTLKEHILESDKAVDPVEKLSSYVDTPDSFNVIYTMPMSAGDVFISTAVIDGLKKEVPEGAKIYFATQDQYKDILEDNPNIHKVIPWNQNMMNIDYLEEVFDLALTPNVATQFTFSNWVRRGQGRLLAEEFANHCQCELGDYFIKSENPDDGVPDCDYMTIHPGSGKGQWEARKYIEWNEILDNLKTFYPDLKIVQVGGEDEPELDNVDFDLRGKTSVHQLAKLIQESKLHLGIDSLTMHLAAAFETPLVALFGSSHANSTGPAVKDKENYKYILLESEYKMGCQKACYKYQCHKNKELPCVNEIDPSNVTEACVKILDTELKDVKRDKSKKYQRRYGKISGYTTTYNLNEFDYPFEESIQSMLGFCDEVVVVDGCSDDGTYEKLEEFAKQDDRVQLYQNPWDFDEPGIDGLQKAFARALCEHDFLWQQDCDEVVHEDDYEKIKMITKRFPHQAPILHLPVIELWDSEKYSTARRHQWKWRFSKNDPNITHGINKHAKVVDEETGRVYAKEGMSDGCEYISVIDDEFIPHVGFWNENFEKSRVYIPDQYVKMMNAVFQQIPSVWHFSWFNLENKINQFRHKWDKQWDCLYQRETRPRFPDIKTTEEMKQKADEMCKDGGEKHDKTKYKYLVDKSAPKIMKDWIERNKRKCPNH